MKKKIDLNKYLPTGIYHLDIKSIKSTKTQLGRYGIQMILTPIKYTHDVIIIHTLYFGNYKDFRSDNPNKSMMIWKMAKNFFLPAKIHLKDLLKLTLTTESIIADVIYEDDNHGFGLRNRIIKVIA